MEKLNEIKAFLKKSTEVMSNLERLAQRISLYSSALSDEIIEQQQDLRRHARRIGVIAVENPFFDDAEYKVLVRFNEFCSFIDLKECTRKANVYDGETSVIYSIIIDNIVFKSVERMTEEHKNAQAI